MKHLWQSIPHVLHHSMAIFIHKTHFSKDCFITLLKFGGNFIWLSSKIGLNYSYKFCTWHDSFAVVACAKIWGDQTIRNWIITYMIFPLTNGKSLVKRYPALLHLVLYILITECMRLNVGGDIQVISFKFAPSLEWQWLTQWGPSYWQIYVKIPAPKKGFLIWQQSHQPIRNHVWKF